MDSINSSFNASEPSISFGKSDKMFNFFMFIIIIIIFFIIVVPWNSLKKEGMSGGTLTQLMAQDSQDVYLKSNVDKLATGNFDLYWNQPTRVANTFQNRGTPLPTFILPDTPMNPNPYPIVASNNYTDYILNKSAIVPNCPYAELDKKSKSNKTIPNPIFNKETQDLETLNGEKIQESDYLVHPNVNKQTKQNKQIKQNTSVPIIPENILPSSLPISTLANSNPYELATVAKQVSTTKFQADNLPALTEWKPIDNLYQSTYNNLLYNKDCIKDPASCGGGAGGFRLGEDYVSSTRAKPYVNIGNNVFYPDGYVGSYFTDDLDFNIMRPIAYMPDSNLPPNPIKMG